MDPEYSGNNLMSEKTEKLPQYSEARKDDPPDYNNGGTQNQRNFQTEKEELVVREKVAAKNLRDTTEKAEKEQKQKAGRKNVFLELFKKKNDNGLFEVEVRFLYNLQSYQGTWTEHREKYQFDKDITIREACNIASKNKIYQLKSRKGRYWFFSHRKKQPPLNQRLLDHCKSRKVFYLADDDMFYYKDRADYRRYQEHEQRMRNERTEREKHKNKHKKQALVAAGCVALFLLL